MIAAKPSTIDEYIAVFPGEVQQKLQQIRNIIRKTAPSAIERISYGIPAFFLDGQYLVYFAGYKKHIGMYPVPGDNAELNKAFKEYYTSGKGTIQFPLEGDLPSGLVTKIVKYRILANRKKAKQKKLTAGAGKKK